MKRKIYNKLKEWKETWNGRCALLIDGARRVGKSWIAEEFGKNEYKSYVIIDFYHISDQIREIFDLYLNEPDNFFKRLSLATGVTFYDRETLIVFDEIQLYPRARGALKYLVKDGRYDFIETGSLMSIHQNVKDILIPSEELTVKMYPMDFEEFMWAMDQKPLYEYAKECFSLLKAPEQIFHRRLMDMMRTYIITGGMPQAIEEYVRSEDFRLVDIIKRTIISLYRNDIIKYAGRQGIKVTQIFDNIPALLQLHERKFKPSLLKKGSRFREYSEAMFWLEDSMVANFCYAVSEPQISLSLTKLGERLKIYMGDTGLLLAMAFDEKTTESEKIFKKIILDKLEFNKGMIIENLVSQQLVSAGYPLYYYSSYSKENSQDRMEIDFLTIKSDITSKHNINAIEVKSSSKYRLISLDKFSNKFNEYINKCYVFHSGTLKTEKDVTFLPLYMSGMI